MSGVGTSRPDTTTPLTIQEEIIRFLQHIQSTQSRATYASHHQAMSVFSHYLATSTPVNINTDTVLQINLNMIRDFLLNLQQTYSPETEHAYFRAVVSFINSLASSGQTIVLLPEQLRNLSQRIRRKKQKQELEIPYELIARTRSFLADQIPPESDPTITIQRSRLRVLRDKALIFTIMDTGLKPSEVADLQIDAIDEGDASIQSGSVQLPIEPATYHAIRDYLHERMPLDQQQPDIQYSSLPLFARHDKRASARILAISRWTVGNIIAYWSKRATETSRGAAHSVTPSLLRHHFVASTLDTTHDLQLTQKRARHKDKGTTRHYLRQTDLPTGD